MTSTDSARDPNAWMRVEGPARRVLRLALLHRRDHLATAAAEHTAHNQIGAELLWLAVEATEARLRTLFPDTWAEQHADWAAIGAARVHTATHPRTSECRLCALNPPDTSSSAAA
jgi:hypothetical protein